MVYISSYSSGFFFLVPKKMTAIIAYFITVSLIILGTLSHAFSLASIGHSLMSDYGNQVGDLILTTYQETSWQEISGGTVAADALRDS